MGREGTRCRKTLRRHSGEEESRKTIGILMLDTDFPRIRGDIGGEGTFPFPVRKKVIPGASTRRVVKQGAEGLLDAFLDSARELEREGAAAITTSCGFLARYQTELANCVSVPVFTSSLMQVPMAAQMLRAGQIVGILTADRSSLTDELLSKIHIEHVPKVIYGMENTLFGQIFVEQGAKELDEGLLGALMEERALQMCAEHPQVGAIVLECTNMPPYGKRVQKATGLPVFDITTLTEYVYSAVCHRHFEGGE